MVGDVSSGRLLQAHAEAEGDQAEALGLKVAKALFDAGAGPLLAG